MQIKEIAEDIGFEVLHGIADCLLVIGEPISVYKEAVEKKTGILTEVDSYDWIAFLQWQMALELTTATLADSIQAKRRSGE